MNDTAKVGMDNLQYAEHVMPLWIDGAKTFAATASAALGLTIIFKEKVLGNSGRMQSSRYLVSSWGSYLLCIGASVTYQWMAVHWIIALRDDPYTWNRPPYYPFPHVSPHAVFGLMMACFFMGSLFLVVASIQELRRPYDMGAALPWSIIRARLRGRTMALPVILSALSAISSALKIVEFVEKHGFMPQGDDLISLNLELANEQPSLASAAIAIQGRVGDAENEVFADAQKRVAECLRSMNDALGDPDVLPDRRKRFGVSGRKCVCSEVGLIRDLLGGSLPDELEQIWKKYKCSEIYQLQPVQVQ